MFRRESSRDAVAAGRILLASAIVLMLVGSGSGCRRAHANRPTLAVIGPLTGLRVFLDDQPVGQTPLRDVPISRGRHRLRVDATSPFEMQVTVDKEGLPVVVFLANDAPKGEETSPIIVRSDTPATTLSAYGERLGTAPLLLIPATYRQLVITAEADARLPVLAEVELRGSPGRELKLRLDQKPSGTPGPIALSAVTVPHIARQDPDGSFVIGPTDVPCTGFVAPDGRRVALYTGVDQLCLFEQTGDGWSGRPLFAWKVRPAAVQLQGDAATTVMSSSLVVLGWRDGDHLVVSTGEPDPSGRQSGQGIGVWILDATGGPPTRVAWFGPEHRGEAAMPLRLTGDSKAVILEHQHPFVSATHFAVADLASGAVRELSADIPHSEFAVGSISLASPDNWSVAYQRPFQSGAAVESDIFVFDLRTGTERKVFSCAKGSLAANFAWAPDSRKLAIGYAPAGERYGLLPGDDYDGFLPPKYVVVTDTGRRLATLSAPGKILCRDPQWSSDSARLAAVEAREVLPPDLSDLSGYSRLIPGDILVFGMDGQCVVVPVTADGEPATDVTPGFTAGGDLVLLMQLGGRDAATTIRTSLVSADGQSRIDYSDRVPLNMGWGGVHGSSLTPFGLLLMQPGSGRIELRPAAGVSVELMPDGLSYGSCSTVIGTRLYMAATKSDYPRYFVIVDLAALAGTGGKP